MIADLQRDRIRISRLVILLILFGCSCQNPTDSGDSFGGLSQVYAVPIATETILFHKAATDSTKLFASADMRVLAFDLATGANRWTYDSSGFPTRIATAGGRVFWTAGEDAIAVDASTGIELWQFKADQYVGFSESDADADAFYFGGEMHKIYAVRAVDGQLLWSRDVGPSWPYKGIVRGLTIHDDSLYAVVEHYLASNGHLSQTEVFAFDRRSGEMFWNYTYGDGTRASLGQSAPRVAGRLLLVQVKWENTIIAIDRFSGVEAWRVVTPGGWFGPLEAPEFANGIAYSGSHLHAEALDIETGRHLWRTPNVADAAGINRFALCGSLLLVNDGGVSAFDRQTGAWLGRGFTGYRDTPYTDFVVVANIAYFVTASHMVALRCPT